MSRPLPIVHASGKSAQRTVPQHAPVPPSSLPSMLSGIMHTHSPADSFLVTAAVASIDDELAAPSDTDPQPAEVTQNRRPSIPTHAPPPPPEAQADSPANPTPSAPTESSSLPSAAPTPSVEVPVHPAPSVSPAPLSPKTSKLLRRIRRREQELEELHLENALLKEANRRANEERVVREQEKRVEARRRKEEEAEWRRQMDELQARVDELTPKDDAHGVRHDPIECARTASELRELLQLRDEQLELINLDRFKLYEEIETWKAGMEKLASLHAGAYSPQAQPASPVDREEDTEGEEQQDEAKEKETAGKPTLAAVPATDDGKSSTVVAPRASSGLSSLLPTRIANMLALNAAAATTESAPTSASSSAPSSAASSVSEAAAAAGSHEAVLEEVWQNEHRHPLAGFQATRSAFLRHPFSDESGSQAREFDQIPLPPGWVWDGAWQVDKGEWIDPEAPTSGEQWRSARADAAKRNAAAAATPGGSAVPPPPSTDAAGWRYSIAMRLFPWHAEPGRLDTVRRRRWMRRRVWVGVEATEAMLQNALAAIEAHHATPGEAKDAQLAAPATAAAAVTDDRAPESKHDAESLAALAAAYSSSDPADSFSMFTSVAPAEVLSSNSAGSDTQGARALAALLQLGRQSKPGSPAPVTAGAPDATSATHPSAPPAAASLTSTVASYIAAPAVNLGAYLASTRLSSWVGGRGGGATKAAAPMPTPVHASSSSSSSIVAPSLDSPPSRSVSPEAPSSIPSPVCSYCPRPSRTALQFVSPRTEFVEPLASFCQRHYHQSQRFIAEEFSANNPHPLSPKEVARRAKNPPTPLADALCAYCSSTDTFPVQLLHLGAPISDAPLDTGASVPPPPAATPGLEVLDAHSVYRFCARHMQYFTDLVDRFQPREDTPPLPSEEEDTQQGEEQQQQQATSAAAPAPSAAATSSSSSSVARPRVLILGANGLIGRLSYHALRADYEVHLLDRSVGADPLNRFGVEGVDLSKGNKEEDDLSIPTSSVHVVDLLADPQAFEALVAQLDPQVVLHYANALETSPLEVIEGNERVNELVLRVCVKQRCACIAASSIMVYYATAMRDPLFSRVLRGDLSAVVDGGAGRFDARTPLRNDEESVRLYTPDEGKLAQVMAYVRGKEALEELAQALVAEERGAEEDEANHTAPPTLIMVRFGWVSAGEAIDEVRREEALIAQGASSAHSSEASDSSTTSETSIIATQGDVRRFVRLLVGAVCEGRVSGFRIYTVVSDHRQRWVNMEDEARDIGFRPEPTVALLAASSSSSAAAPNAADDAKPADAVPSALPAQE